MANDPTASQFEALGDPTRRAVLVALASDGSATATQLAEAFPVTRQAVAKHLQILLDAGLVQAERRGRETIFAFVPGSLGPVAEWIVHLDDASGDAWRDSVAALQRHLTEQRARRGLAAAPGPLRAAASARPRPPRA